MADYQQVYHIELPASGEVGDLERMGLLWSQLPASSRVARLQDPSLVWDESTWMLWRLEYELRCLTWSLTYDKRHPAAKPKPLPDPEHLAEARLKRDHALAARAEVDRALGIKGV